MNTSELDREVCEFFGVTRANAPTLTISRKFAPAASVEVDKADYEAVLAASPYRDRGGEFSSVALVDLINIARRLDYATLAGQLLLLPVQPPVLFTVTDNQQGRPYTPPPRNQETK